MLYMPEIADYLKILTDEEVKDFVVINFGECFKSTREKLYFKLGEGKMLGFDILKYKPLSDSSYIKLQKN